MSFLSAIAYLISSVLFILAIYGLASPKTAKRGNLFGMVGMALAIATTISLPNIENKALILIAISIGGAIGSIIALKVQMTSMPQLVAGFHSLVGLAAVLIAASALYAPEAFGILHDGHIKTSSLVEMGLGLVIGAITFSGSIVAFAKLNGNFPSAVKIPAQKFFGIAMVVAIVVLLVIFFFNGSKDAFLILTIISIIFGLYLIAPIGGADMPVVVSMLNSYSGWAAVGIGFTLGNNLLIITGALVGASGAILSYIMCKAMNRSIFNVIFGGFGTEEGVTSSAGAGGEEKPVKQGSAEDAAFLMKNAKNVIIVPGYGMAVAGAQHAVSEMVDVLEAEGVEVKFAIHPVAGRMPGHMNVLLAEASVDYEKVFELEEINNEFKSCDVVFVIGANDVTNPAAKTDKASPIYGMPILDVEHAQTVVFVKRGMAAGYAGVQNELFFKDNTMMVFGDAKKVVESVIKEV